jgi:hypothetical protein
MSDLDLEMLAAELTRRGLDRDGIIFAICCQHDMQWSEVAPIVDHVLAIQPPQMGMSMRGLRPVLYLAGFVLGGGLMITAGLEAINLAKVVAPEAGLWELIKMIGSQIVGSPKLWSQIILGGIVFAYSLGRLLALFAHIQQASSRSS